MEAEDNRAVSALFRVFGGGVDRPRADRVELTRFRGMHRGEAYALAVLVPLTVAVAGGEWLVRWCGWAAGLALALPAGFLALNALALVVPGRTMSWQWRAWLACLAAWGGWRAGAGGIVGCFAWLWLGIVCVNAAAAGWWFLGKWLRGGRSGGMAGRVGVLAALHGLALAAGFRFGGWWGVATAAMVDAACLGVVLNPASQWLGRVVRRGEGREILLTIDDGPDAEDTPRLLDLLDAHGRKAIFFMIGEKVAARPDLAREVLRRGHEIGNHTMTHPQATFWCAGPWRTRREIARCQRTIEEATGFSPRWFRAPVGHRNWFTHPVVWSLGLEVMGWSRRGYDAVEKDAAVVLGRILPFLEEGDIVLIHEGTPVCEEVARGVLEGMGER